MDDFIGEEDAEHFEGISDGYTDDDEDDDDDYSSRRESPRSSSGAGSAQPKSPNDTPVLDNFGTDMTRAAAENRLDPIVGREKEYHPAQSFPRFVRQTCDQLGYGIYRGWNQISRSV